MTKKTDTDMIEPDRTGADPAWVQRVHLHLLRFGNGCNAPVQKRTRGLQKRPVHHCMV